MSPAVDREGQDADLAAEYALGVLDGEERRHVERRAAADPEFARELDNWNEMLTPMVAGVAEHEPSDAVWHRITGRLDRMTRGPQASAGIVAVRTPSVWQWLAAGGLGVAVGGLATLLFVGTFGSKVLTPDQVVGGQALTATLVAETGQPLITVVVDEGTASATLIPVASPPPRETVPELWLLPGGDADPKSLGVIDDSRPLRLDFATSGIIGAGETLAISLEPVGGSPTGQPTGPVVASGQLAEL